ncbi:SDR family NAD(P)-dependent oxidoreductase [Rugamonas sp. A1-17]|nr:SDR family NAD(P)-dependent oxidoreductase [Rugamonas sp. A1-17]
MACEFPDSRTPGELWDTVLQARRCFRAIPRERLDLSDYAAEGDPDGIYPIEAGLLEGYQFDRERFRIPLSTFERTDMAHWLALDVATRALCSLDSTQLDEERDSMAVIVANTLTGEFSRAHALRYRWPYLQKTIRAAADGRLADADVTSLLAAAESRYKAPLPEPDEDSLAGGLSNTIAGRIANYHHLRGGAHTVDGACASSLVAIASAYERLAMGDTACVLVGAVDLSLDPFELVGFARNGAMARQLMRVFDSQAEGFWPGEGCGFVVLAREEAAVRHGWPVLAWLRGAAMSTDGQGAITRPTVEGQTLAARRAWARAGLNPAQADYFEAHGTGTPTGDEIELAGLAALFGDTGPAKPIPIGSVKANIGHTKAAAGMAGLLKAIAICRERLIPPTTGCIDPHPLLAGEIGGRIAVRAEIEPVPHALAVTVGINSFGFGGVNCHAVLQGEPGREAAAPPGPPADAIGGELFQLSAADPVQLAGVLDRLAHRACSLSRAQLPDLAHALAPDPAPAWRVSVTASTPQELAVVAKAAAAALRQPGRPDRQIGRQFSWSAPAEARPRIAFLFAGQGISIHLQTLPWAARFPSLAESAQAVDMLARQDRSDTAVFQPLLAELAIAGIELLRDLRIGPDIVLGHSFGELPALYASGQMTVEELRRLARQRGRCMCDLAPVGAMLAVSARREVADAIAVCHGLELACENGAERFVLAGDPQDVLAAAAACSVDKLTVSVLPTSRAFHTSGMAAVRHAFAPHAAAIAWRRPLCRVVSSITGAPLDGAEPVAQLLARQVTDTVRFASALAHLEEVDLIVEVGAGNVLAGLAEEQYPGRVVTMELFSDNLQAMLAVAGAAWVCGAALNHASLYTGRRLRYCALDAQPLFLRNPCGAAADALDHAPAPASPSQTARPEAPPHDTGASSLETLKAVVAEQTGLSSSGLNAGWRLLDDLHLNSIRARHVVALTAQRLGMTRMPFELARMANASLAEAASYLDELRSKKSGAREGVPAGIAPWLRFYTHHWKTITAAPPSATQAPTEALLHRVVDAGAAPTPSLLLDDAEAGRQLAILVLPAGPGPAAANALLNVAQRLLPAGDVQGLLVLQARQLANGFLQSVADELPRCRVCAVEYADLDRVAVLQALAEHGRAELGYAELRLRSRHQQRRVLREVRLAAAPWTPLPGAVLLVTGGARGIGAVSARALARQYRYRLALLGRSPPNHDEVERQLALCHEEGIDAHYFQVDIGDEQHVSQAVRAIQSGIGKIRAVLHAAGTNHPAGINNLSPQDIASTLAAKVTGLRHVLDCLPPTQLDLLIGYGSIISAFGLAGEAHYALANEWLGELLDRVKRAAPTCRVLRLDWTAWRELGMAQRIEGVMDGLRQSGTRPLDNEEALAALIAAVESAQEDALIISGRYGRRLDADDLRRLQPSRYLEQPRVFYPGVELVAEAEICSDADRYLQDHAPYGIPVFPLVCAVEAMLSAAQILLPDTGRLDMLDMQVAEGISCSLGQRFVLRTCALVNDDGQVKVELRTSLSGFETAHFTALFACGRSLPPLLATAATPEWVLPAKPLLYQGLCFHGERFQQVAAVLRLSSTACTVRLAAAADIDWYGPMLPGQLAGGIPALRDAVLHALQLCIPHQVVLPVSVAEVSLGKLSAGGEYLVHAQQRFSDGMRFVFDIVVQTADGAIIEQWRGLELRRGGGVVQPLASLAPELLAVLTERLLADGLGVTDLHAGMAISDDRAEGRRLAAARGQQGPVVVSATHADGLTLVLTGEGRPAALDLQFSPGYRLDEWRLMLGDERMRFVDGLVAQRQVPADMALLFAWTISECLIKLGLDGWPWEHSSLMPAHFAHIGPAYTFQCGPLRGMVTGLRIAGRGQPAALALALRQG